MRHRPSLLDPGRRVLPRNIELRVLVPVRPALTEAAVLSPANRSTAEPRQLARCRQAPDAAASGSSSTASLTAYILHSNPVFSALVQKKMKPAPADAGRASTSNQVNSDRSTRSGIKK